MLKDEFIVPEKEVSENNNKYKIKFGRKYATSLTAFLAGIVVGMLFLYIILVLI